METDFMNKISSLVSEYNFQIEQMRDSGLSCFESSCITALYYAIEILVSRLIETSPDISDACIAEDRFGQIKIDCVFEEEHELC